MNNKPDDAFNYDQVNVEVFKSVIEKCFAKKVSDKHDLVAIGVLDGVATLLHGLTVPVKQRQWLGWVIFGGLTIVLAAAMSLAGWPHIPYPTIMAIAGLLAAAAIAGNLNRIIFRSAVRKATITANTRGIVLEWFIEQRPDLQYIWDDLAEAGLPVRQAIRRFVTNRPVNAVPPKIVAQMRDNMNTRRQELLS